MMPQPTGKAEDVDVEEGPAVIAALVWVAVTTTDVVALALGFKLYIAIADGPPHVCFGSPPQVVLQTDAGSLG